MHRYLTALLLVVVLLQPIQLRAETADADNGVLRDQLAAISAYLSRAFLPQPDEPLTEDELRETVDDGVTFLINAQEENGHFRYEYHPYDGTYSNDDNMVRQAGTLYSLGEIVSRSTKPDPDLFESIESAIGYFEDRSKDDTYNGRTFHCVAGSTSSLRCKLGTTALALAGILGYVEANPDAEAEYDDLIETYKEYLLAAKKDGAGFRNTHRVEADEQTDDESPFFNGEALMALVRYYAYDPDPEVKAVIDETFDYLSSKEEFETPLYLWIMAAVKDLYARDPREEYVSYTKAFTDWRVTGVSRYRHTDNNYCAYLEGIASAYSVLDGEIPESELTALRDEIDYWLLRNDRLQLDTDHPYRVVPKDGTLTLAKLADPERAHGGFLTAHDELRQRIDFTQHCITSYVQVLTDIEGAELY